MFFMHTGILVVDSQAALDEAGPEVVVLRGEIQHRPSVVCCGDLETSICRKAEGL